MLSTYIIGINVCTDTTYRLTNIQISYGEKFYLMDSTISKHDNPTEKDLLYVLQTRSGT